MGTLGTVNGIRNLPRSHRSLENRNRPLNLGNNEPIAPFHRAFPVPVAFPMSRTEAPRYPHLIAPGPLFLFFAKAHIKHLGNGNRIAPGCKPPISPFQYQSVAGIALIAVRLLVY